MNLFWFFIAAASILAGLLGSVIPAVPGIPLIFAGIWVAAWTDQFRHTGFWWLCAIAAVGGAGLTLDLTAAALGARRVGASPRALWGALIGTVLGLFMGLPGLLLGPFLGAMVGEISSGSSMLRSTHVGIGTWLGLIFGTLCKVVCSFTMLAMFGAAWWLHRA